MFEKEAEEYAENTIENWNYRFTDEIEYKIKQTWQDGAEFGYNKCKEEIDYLNKHWSSEEERKANEWHYVKDGDFPKDKTEKGYLVALKSEYIDFFYETDIWCESLHCFASNNPKKVYAWKEIVPPELPKEIE